MQSTIWKFSLEQQDEQFIIMPADAEILSVQEQQNQPCIWARVNPQTTESIHVKVVIVGTGNPAEHTTDMLFLGTYQLYEGCFVGHVFVDRI